MSAGTLKLLIAGTLGVIAVALAAETFDVTTGQREYQANCAACHGASGAGGGPLTDFLPRPPPDLTACAMRNGGSFPTELAWHTIDGRSFASEDKLREMPLWGESFEKAALGSPEPPGESEQVVNARIWSLVDYLKSIQR